MPLYEYRCEKCSRTIEVIQKFSDKPLRKCERCGGKLVKLVSASGFVLKGSGWYVSDYKGSKGGTDEGKAADAGAAKEAPASSDDAAGGGTSKPEPKKPAAEKTRKAR